MFNSALIYELAVLKQYVEPLLFGIERDCREYLEAKRLLKFLDYFVWELKAPLVPGQLPAAGVYRRRMLPGVVRAASSGRCRKLLCQRDGSSCGS